MVIFNLNQSQNIQIFCDSPEASFRPSSGMLEEGFGSAAACME